MNKKFLLKMKEVNFIKLIITSTLVVSLLIPQFNQIYALNYENVSVKSAAGSMELKDQAFRDAFPDAKFRNALRELGIGKGDTDTISKTDDFFRRTDLYVTYKGIESLKGIEYFTSLQELNCVGNQLTTLDVSNNLELVNLECENNKLIDLDLSNNLKLTNLECENNGLTNLDVSRNLELTLLNCRSNELTTLDLSKNLSLKSLSCESNKLTTLDINDNSNLTYLNCNYNQLTKLDVSDSIALQELYCQNNQLTALNVKNTLKLMYLSCENNELTTLDVSNSIDLVELYCSNNKLMNLGLENTKSLTILDCNYNELTNLDLSFSPNIEKLSSTNNQLKTLNVSKNLNLKELNVVYNELTTLDLSTSLVYLICSNNRLTTLDLSNNINLEGLGCDNNQLTTLDLSKSISLKVLLCNNNRLTTLDTINNKNLANLFPADQVRELNLSKQSDGKYSVYIGKLSNIDDYAVKELSSGTYVDGYIVWDSLESVPKEVTYDYILKSDNYPDGITMNVKLSINKSTSLKVSFESNGGSTVEAEVIESGQHAIKPANPTKTNSTFVGWYTDSKLTTPYDFNSAVNQGMVLYAKWTPTDENSTGLVILASGEKYTDVLTATVLGNEKNAPILLAKKDSIDDKTLAEIKRLNTEEIIISGGENSVSNKVVDQLKGYKVTRIAGADRYETAEKIGDEVRKTGNKSGSMLVDGTNFPDVITISSLASQRRVPILLTEPKTLNKTTKDTIKAWGINNITIGGSYNSVSKDIESNLGMSNITRFGGEDRYKTAELIGNEVRKLTKNNDDMIIVDGTNFPDGLTVNSLAAKFKSPIMLTAPNTLNKVTGDKITDWSIKNILIGGGYNSVSKMIEDNLKVDKKERVAGLDRYETAVKISQRLSNATIPLGGK